MKECFIVVTTHREIFKEMEVKIMDFHGHAGLQQVSQMKQLGPNLYRYLNLRWRVVRKGG